MIQWNGTDMLMKFIEYSVKYDKLNSILFKYL